MSTLSLRKIKHDSSSVDNVTLNSNGTTTMGGELNVTSLKGVSGNKLQLRSGDSSYGVSLQNISGIDLLGVDAVGRVTMPYQPAFAVYNNSNQSFSSTGTQVVDMTNAIFNRGNAFNLSTNTFTAPISGVYHFSYAGMMMGQNTSTAFVNLSMRVNGGIYSENMQQSFNKADYNTIAGSYIVSLSANDNVDFVIYYAGANSGSYLRGGSNMNTFMGYLLG